MITADFCGPGEVREILARAKSKKTDREGQFDLDALIQRGQCVKVTNAAGKIVAAYVLEAQGKTLWVSAAAGKADFDLCRVIAVLLEQHGRTFDQIGFATERAGLVKKAKREGYEVVRYIMRKKIK